MFVVVAIFDIWACIDLMVSEQPREVEVSSVAATIQGILEDRGRIDFMTVARAMVLQAHQKGEEASRVLADQLGISRQTRHNWLKVTSIAEWHRIWAERLVAARARGAPPSLVRRKLSDSDWRWIAGVLASCGASTWDKKRAAVAREAVRENSGMAHLRGIHRVTLFRNRGRLAMLGEELRSSRMTFSLGQPNRPLV